MFTPPRTNPLFANMRKFNEFEEYKYHIHGSVKGHGAICAKAITVLGYSPTVCEPKNSILAPSWKYFFHDITKIPNQDIMVGR